MSSKLGRLQKGRVQIFTFGFLWSFRSSSSKALEGLSTKAFVLEMCGAFELGAWKLQKVPSANVFVSNYKLLMLKVCCQAKKPTLHIWWSFWVPNLEVPLGAKCKKTCAQHVLELSNLEFRSSNRGPTQFFLCLATLEFLWIGQSKNVFGLQFLVPKVKGRVHFFCTQPLMDPRSNLPGSSMKDQSNFFHSTSHGTPQLWA